MTEKSLDAQLMDAARPQSRTVYTYTMPAGLAQESGFQSIGMVELTGDEERNATKRVFNEPMRLAQELPIESVRTINGKPVSTADGSAESAWSKMPPKVRSLVTQAYGVLHQPKTSDVQSFLDSVKVQVG